MVERGPAGRVPRQARAADHALLRRRPHQAGRGDSANPLHLDSHDLTQPILDLQVRVGNSTEPGDNQLCNWIPKEIEEGATEVLDCYEDLVGR